jgi:hypothetical protein
MMMTTYLFFGIDKEGEEEQEEVDPGIFVVLKKRRKCAIH